MNSPALVIFACVHNAGRSQIAAAFFNALADPLKARATSAGTAPGDRVHPEVAAAMSEAGIDLSAARPQKLTTEIAAGAQMLVTMGCGDACPVIPGKRYLDWALADPHGMGVDGVREVRDDIATVRKACEGQVLKVIIETCLLTDEQKRTACRLAAEAKADFVKTSTGFSTGGATVEDVRLMRGIVGDALGVKASGGIRDWDTALAMIAAGANRIGASSGVALLTGAPASGTGY